MERNWRRHARPGHAWPRHQSAAGRAWRPGPRSTRRRTSTPRSIRRSTWDHRPQAQGLGSSPWRSSPPTREPARRGAGTPSTPSPAREFDPGMRGRSRPPRPRRRRGGVVRRGGRGASWPRSSPTRPPLKDRVSGDRGVRADPHRLRHRGGRRPPTTRRSTGAARRSRPSSRRRGRRTRARRLFTLPVLPTGLTADGLYVLQSACATA